MDLTNQELVDIQYRTLLGFLFRAQLGSFIFVFLRRPYLGAQAMFIAKSYILPFWHALSSYGLLSSDARTNESSSSLFIAYCPQVEVVGW